MDSRQLIRTTRKVLATIEALNQHQALRVAEMSRILGLPRTTTFRLLETLRDLGYISRREDDLRYHLTSRILALSAGFDLPLEITEIAKPVLDRLCGDVRWPVSVSSLHGVSMRLLYTTDALTPHKIFTSTAGIDMPLLATASGIVQLAFCNAESRRILLATAPRANGSDPGAASAPEGLEELLRSVRARGYHFVDRSYVEHPDFKGFQTKECIAAVPILCREEPVAVVASRMVSKAVTHDWITRVLVPKLKAAAAEIAEAYTPRPEKPSRGTGHGASVRRPAGDLAAETRREIAGEAVLEAAD